MTQTELAHLFTEYAVSELCWDGSCHYCDAPVQVVASLESDGGVIISGGAVYWPKTNGGNAERKIYLKCDACFEAAPKLQNGPPLETYSRVVGYLRPIANWNRAKQAEFRDRKTFDKALRAAE